MKERKPHLEDYEITPTEYRLYMEDTGGLGVVSFLIVFLVSFVMLAVALDLGILEYCWFAFLISAIATMPVSYALKFVVMRYKDSSLMVLRPLSSRVELYHEALAIYQAKQEEAERVRYEAQQARREAERQRVAAERERLRKQADYWMNLSGGVFESELATLFKRRGYRVELKGGAGDGGIDILAWKDGKTTIIQCKRYKNPAGPAAARELYGSLMASGADRGILACTAGWTKGVEDFVEGLEGKPITLADVWDIIRVAEAVEGNRAEFTPPEPRRASRWRGRRPRW